MVGDWLQFSRKSIGLNALLTIRGCGVQRGQGGAPAWFLHSTLDAWNQLIKFNCSKPVPKNPGSTKEGDWVSTYLMVCVQRVSFPQPAPFPFNIRWTNWHARNLNNHWEEKNLQIEPRLELESVLLESSNMTSHNPNNRPFRTKRECNPWSWRPEEQRVHLRIAEKRCWGELGPQIQTHPVARQPIDIPKDEKGTSSWSCPTLHLSKSRCGQMTKNGNTKANRGAKLFRCTFGFVLDRNLLEERLDVSEEEGSAFLLLLLRVVRAILRDIEHSWVDASDQKLGHSNRNGFVGKENLGPHERAPTLKRIDRLERRTNRNGKASFTKRNQKGKEQNPYYEIQT